MTICKIKNLKICIIDMLEKHRYFIFIGNVLHCSGKENVVDQTRWLTMCCSNFHHNFTVLCCINCMLCKKLSYIWHLHSIPRNLHRTESSPKLVDGSGLFSLNTLVAEQGPRRHFFTYSGQGRDGHKCSRAM